MSRIKKILLPILAALMCTMLALGTIYMLPKKTASAYTANRPATVTGGDIYNGSKFDYDNLRELYGQLLGDGATFADVINAAKAKTAYGQFDAVVNNGANDGDIIVTFAGNNWTPTYLSVTQDDPTTSVDESGDVILTLYSSWYTQTGFWSANYTNSVGTYACDLYGTSYMRSVLLNNGGAYYKSNTALYDDPGQVTSNAWAKFNMDTAADSVSKYMVEPRLVAWQERQEANGLPKTTTTTFAQNLSNDAWATDITIANYDLQGLAYYSVWKNDKVWLPSVTEIMGLWQLPVSVRQSHGSKAFTWTRSATDESYQRSYEIDSTGYPQGSTVTTNANYTMVVRPAIHLNLTLAEESCGIKQPNETLTATYTGEQIEFDDIDFGLWYDASKYDDYTIGTGVSATGVKVTIPANTVDVGTYTITFSVTGTDSGHGKEYFWIDTTDKVITRTLKVVRKKIDTQFTVYPPTLQVDAATGWPEAEIVNDNQIYARDKGSGVNAANTPVIGIQYVGINGTSGTIYSGTTGAHPTKPGTYKVSTYMVNYDTCNYDVQCDDSFNLIVTPIAVISPSLSANTLIYSSADQNVGIDQWSDKITVTAKNGSKYVNSGTSSYVYAKNEGTYTVTFGLADPETMVWYGTNSSDSFDTTFTIKQRRTLSSIVADPSNHKDITFTDTKFELPKGSEFKFTVKLDLITDDADPGKILPATLQPPVLYVYYTTSSGSTITLTSDAGGVYTLKVNNKSENPNDYTLHVELAPITMPGASDNGNYTFTDIVRTFTVTSQIADFKPSDLVWAYSAPTVSLTEFTAGNYSLEYIGEYYTVSVKNAATLPLYGVIIDTSSTNGYVNGYKGDFTAIDANTGAAVYTVEVNIIADPAGDFTYNGGPVTFTWTITPVYYDFAYIKWSGPDLEYTGFDQKVEILVDSRYPDLTASVSCATQWQVNEGGTPYKASILSFSNNNNPNYILPVRSDPSTYDPSFEWDIDWYIVKATLHFSWTLDTYYDTNGVEFQYAKVVTNDNYVNVVYYHDTDVSIDGTGQVTLSGTPLMLSQIVVIPTSITPYYAVAQIKATEAGYYKLDYTEAIQCWYYWFEVGSNKRGATLAFEEDIVTYDGNEHALATDLTITGAGTAGLLATDFEMLYYVDNNGSLGAPLGGDGKSAPVNAGKYIVKISLTASASSQYVIVSGSKLNFEIKTLKLTPPGNIDNLTYNGEWQDLAEIFSLPDSWQNYLDISIVSNTTGIDNPTGSAVRDAGRYSVSFAFQAGINPASGTNNVEWNITSNKTATRQQTVIVDRLILHATGWDTNGYYSGLIFKEEDADKFVEYVVKDSSGNPVDADTVNNSDGETFTVVPTIPAEHGTNVDILFEPGLPQTLQFTTSKDGLPTYPDYDNSTGSGGGTTDPGNGDNNDPNNPNNPGGNGGEASGGSGNIGGNNTGLSDDSFTKWLSKNWWWLLIIAIVMMLFILLMVIILVISGRRREERMMEMFMHSQQNMPAYQMPVQQPVIMQIPNQGEPAQLQLPAGQFDEETLKRAFLSALREANGTQPQQVVEPEIRTEYIHTGIDDDDGFYDDYTGYDDNNL